MNLNPEKKEVTPDVFCTCFVGLGFKWIVVFGINKWYGLIYGVRGGQFSLGAFSKMCPIWKKR